MMDEERKQKMREYVDRLAEGNLPPPVFKDESLAPDVDRDILMSLVRRDLPEDQARLVYMLTYSFKSWSDAHLEALTEEHHAGRKKRDE
jgi:hypothetical protein